MTDGIASDSGTFTITVDPNISTGPSGTMTLSAQSVNEGQTLVLSGTVTVSEGAFPASVEILADGIVIGSASVATNGASTWSTIVSDDNPTGTPIDLVTFSARAPLPADPQVILAAYAPAQLINVDPAIQITLINPNDPNAPGNEIGDGGIVRAEVVVTDAGTLDTHFVHIVWGDGSDDIVPVEAGEPTFIDHEYAPRPPEDQEPEHIYPIEATVFDDDGGGATVLTSVLAQQETGGTTGPASITISDGASYEGTGLLQPNKITLTLTYSGPAQGPNAPIVVVNWTLRSVPQNVGF